MPPSSVALAVPEAGLLDGYVAALRAGWSPSATRDMAAEQLADIAADPGAFLANLAREDGGTTRDAGGREIQRLAGPIRWILADGQVAGTINLRYVAGTLDLPDHVSGHIGYAVVPWMRNRGIARAALAAMLPIARGAGLPRVKLTCDTGNVASRRVIEACGGIGAGRAAFRGQEKLEFWIET